MKTRIRGPLGCGLFAMLCVYGGLSAASSEPPSVSEVALEKDDIRHGNRGDTLTLTGTDLVGEGAPTIYLGQTGPLEVLEATATAVTVLCPPSVGSTEGYCADGHYRLSITTGKHDSLTRQFEISIGINQDIELLGQLDSESASRAEAVRQLADDLQVERDIRRAADDSESGARKTAVGALEAKLAAEAAARAAADDQLAADLATETAARTAADSAEATARSAADDQLTADLATETAARAAAEAAETAARTAADDQLATELAAEAAARAAADGQLQVDLAAETAARTAADQQLAADLTTETAARAAADNAEATARTAADSAEATARIQADTVEAAARSSADDTLQAALNAETAARTAADSAEATARDAADTALGARVDGLLDAPLVISGDVPGPDTTSFGNADPYLPEHHVLVVNNTRATTNQNDTTRHNTGGVAVVLTSHGDQSLDPLNSINTDDNFITFFHQPASGEAQIVGRIEGVSAWDIGNLNTKMAEFLFGFNPLKIFQVNAELNPISDWLVVDWQAPSASLSGGALPSAALTGGTLPSASLTGGSLPSAGLSGGKLPSASLSPGSLPTASFSRGSLMSLEWGGAGTCNDGGGDFEICVQHVLDVNVDYGSLPSLTFSGGSLPSLAFDPGKAPALTFSPGKFPSLNMNPGTLPQLDWQPGALPNLTFDPGHLSLAQSQGPFKSFGLTTDPDGVAEVIDDLGVIPGLAGMAWAQYKDPVGFALKYGKASFKAGITYESGAGDYAEWLERLDPAEQISMGDIVGVFGGRISKRTAGADHLMVTSFKPIVLGNMPDPARVGQFEKVAFMGQTAVKVRGPVLKGDYIVASGLDDGTGFAVTPGELSDDQFDKVVGVAWSDGKSGLPVNLVNLAVGLRPGELNQVIRDQQQAVRVLRDENRQLAASLDALRGEVADTRQQLAEVAALHDSVAALKASLARLQRESLAPQFKVATAAR